MSNVEKDYYAALGVPKDATASDVKKAYRKLARDNHPDTHPGDANAEATFKEVSEAYSVLSDDAKRREYDEQRALFAGGGRFGGGGAYPGGGPTPGFDMSDLFGGSGGGSNLNDLFDGLFGGGAARGGGGGGAGGGPGGSYSFRTSASGGPRRGKDVNATVDLGFEEAVRGTTLPLKLNTPGPCRNCHGSGARPGTSPRQCPTCGGSGSIIKNQGGFGFSEPCRECRGSGKLIDDPCPVCHGHGQSTDTRTITVRIPSGVRDGAKIRVPGKGTPGANGAPAGDLYVTVNVAKHALFGRTGDDLTLKVPITFAEAALGTTLRVPTLDAPVSLKVAPGTPSGRTLRVRGRGVTTKKGSGDLLVTVDVAVPAHLDDAAREALEAYAAADTTDPRPAISRALGARTEGASS